MTVTGPMISKDAGHSSSLNDSRNNTELPNEFNIISPKHKKNKDSIDSDLLKSKDFKQMASQDHLAVRPLVTAGNLDVTHRDDDDAGRSLNHNINDAEYALEMEKLTEWVLLRRGFYRWILPSIIYSFFGSFLPYFSVFIPVHESKQCLCSRI